MNVPTDLWSLLGLAVVTIGGIVGAEATARRQRKTQTEQIVETLQGAVSTIDTKVTEVSQRLDEHIAASNGRVRGEHTGTEPVPIKRERRRPKETT